MSRSRNRDRNNIRDYGILNSSNSSNSRENNNTTTENVVSINTAVVENKFPQINDFINNTNSAGNEEKRVSQETEKLTNPTVITQAPPVFNSSEQISRNTVVRTISKPITDGEANISNCQGVKRIIDVRNNTDVSNYNPTVNTSPVHHINKTNNATTAINPSAPAAGDSNVVKTVTTTPTGTNVEKQHQQQQPKEEKVEKCSANEKQSIAYKAYCYLNGNKKMPEKNFSDKEIAKILKEYSLSRYGRVIPHEVLVESIKTS